MDRKQCIWLFAGIIMCGVAVLISPWALPRWIFGERAIASRALLLAETVPTLIALGAGIWFIGSRRHLSATKVLAVCVMGAICASLCLVMDLATGYLIIISQSRNVLLGTPIAQPDERFGWALRPGAKACFHTANGGENSYSVDSHGRRVTPYRPNPTFNLHLLGDSFVFGTGVDDSETISWHLSEKHLSDRVAVHNLGVPGYGLVQMCLQFFEIEAQLNAGDVVVLAPISHDFERNIESFDFVAQQMIVSRGQVRFFPTYRNGMVRSVRIDTPWNCLKFLCHTSPLCGRIWSQLRDRLSPSSNDVNHEIVCDIRRRCQSRGVGFCLVILPCLRELRAGTYMSGIPNLEFEDIRFHFAASGTSVEDLYLAGDGHFSPDGNRFVASVLAGIIMSKGMFPADVWQETGSVPESRPQQPQLRF